MLPTSGQFDVFDWNARATETAYGKSIIDSTYGLVANAITAGQVVVDNAGLALLADAEVATGTSTIQTIVRAALPIALPSFTFEIEFIVGHDLPATFTDPASRVYFGLGNPFGYGFGLLVSRKGLAVASSRHDTNPVLLHGSSALVYSADGTPKEVVVRGLVLAGRLAIYTADAANAYDTQACVDWWLYPNLDLKYNIAAMLTPSAVAPGLELCCSAQTKNTLGAKYPGQDLPGETALVVVRSVRLSTQQLVPTARPVATITAQTQALAHSAVVFDGSSSYDKFLPLTFLWDLVSVPVGSTAKLQGGQPAMASTAAAVETEGDVVIVYAVATSQANSYKLQIVNPGTASSTLTATFSAGVLRIALGTDNAGAATTTAAQLQTALYQTLFSTSGSEVADKFSCYLAKATGTGSGIVPTGVFAFIRGAGSTLPAPALLPDVSGPYVVSLVVNNGTRNSVKVTHTLLALATDNLLGHIPDASYIFKYLPDFWKLVQNKAQISATWSAVAQVVSSEMLALWQHDFSKSVRDITRKYQRRWLSFETAITAPPATVVRPVPYLSLLSGTAFAAQGILTSNQGQTYTVVTPVVTVPAKVLLFADSYPALVGHITTIKKVGQAWLLGFAGDGVPVVKLITSGTDGVFVYDPTINPATVPATSSRLTSRTASTVHLETNDCVRLANGAKSLVVVTQTSDTFFQLGAGAAQLVDASVHTFDVVRSIKPTLVVKAHLQFGADVDLNSYGVSQGDCLSVNAKDPYTHDGVIVYLPIEAYDKTTLFVDWSPLVSALNLLAQADGDAQVWTEVAALALTITLQQFHYCGSLLPETDMEHVPYLGHTTLDFPLLENRDYVVDDEQIKFVPVAKGTVIVADAATATSLLDFKFVPGMALYIPTGPVGTYKILARNIDGSLLLDRPVPWAGVVQAEVVRYSAYAPPPVRFWSELAFFDNWRTVEGNFGLFVGMPKKLLTDNNSSADYLDVIKTLCYAYMHTSTKTTFELVANTLAGVGFVGEDSQIVYVEWPADTHGHVVLRNKHLQDYTLLFPKGAEFATNPRTQRVYKAYLGFGISGPDFDDAQVSAFSSIFAVSRVVDYISDPVRAALEFSGVSEVKKFSTFIVDIPVDVIHSTSSIALIRDVFKELRSANTDFVIYGSLHLSDVIAIADVAKRLLTMRLCDTPNSTAVATTASTLSASAWPVEAVGARGWAAAEATERYDSGWQDGILDDYSGDGSWNKTHSALDQVNVFDGDIDWARSTMLVCVEMTSTAEFTVGAALKLLVGGQDVTVLSWVASPPVVKFVGSGANPEIPFVYSPQLAHPYTYIVLGFDSGAIVECSSARFTQLRSLWANNFPGQDTVLAVVGTPATARITFVPRLGIADDARYFELVPVFGFDKLLEQDPKSSSEQILSYYIPSAGSTVADVQTLTPALNPNNAASALVSRTFQQLILDNMLPSNTSMYVPRPGSYTAWANAQPADRFVLDYVDIGALATNPTGNFDMAGVAVKNFHVTMRHNSRKSRHYTHGETPLLKRLPPVIVSVASSGLNVRIEGWHFIAQAANMTVEPTAAATSFTGDLCGCWVFFRRGADEYPVTLLDGIGFVTGFGLVGELVLGATSDIQTRTGHVLLVVPPVLAAGRYDVIVRQYYKHQKLAGGPVNYAMDEDIKAEAYEVA